MNQLLVTTASVLALMAGGAAAQVVEENAAPVPLGEQRDTLDGPVAAPQELSSEPLGVDLRGIFVAPGADGNARDLSGVDVSAVDANSAALAGALAAYVGQPLSQALIGDIRAVVVAHYRENDLPLVSVTVPPQEVTSGVLQLAVTVFKLGTIITDGNERTPDAHILGSVRLEPGAVVDSGVLLEDLNWLNQNPYRNIAAVFEPGRKAGETDLTLRSREVKPWQVYAGYQNSGVESTDRGRVFAGFNTANIPFTDHLLSYQLTASPDFWWDDGPLDDAGHAQYESHSLSYFVPLPWRHKLTVQASYIDSNAELARPFSQESESVQAYIDYAVPVQSQGDLRFDAYGLVEWKQQNTAVSFGGIPVRKTTLGIAQLGGGVRGSVQDGLGVTGFDLRGVVSPGGVAAHNDDADFVAATGNPNVDATYAYVFGSAQRSTPIAGLDSQLNTSLRFQVGSTELPGIEQFSAGGANTVRGYEALEASGAAGVTFSNELRFEALPVLSAAQVGVEDQAVSYVFVDAAYVQDDFSRTRETLLGTGVGADYALDRFVSIGASLGVAVLETRATDAGDMRGHISATFRY